VIIELDSDPLHGWIGTLLLQLCQLWTGVCNERSETGGVQGWEKNIYIFDSTVDDQANSTSDLTLDRMGLLRLNLVFKTVPTENLSIILIDMSQAAMAITADRRVLLNHLM
jgi:hypothetical protein